MLLAICIIYLGFSYWCLDIGWYFIILRHAKIYYTMPGSTSSRIDFNEPIPEMIERLKREHRNFESRLDKVDNSINRDNDIVDGMRIIRNMSEAIIHHAVEEEARLIRVIMQNTKDESSESIKIMQEHNWILNFFKNKLTSTEDRKTYLKSQAEGEEEYNKQAKKELNEFVANLRSHFLEEEQIVFPLALRANLLS
jgi:hemerythrin-like domain-containing protein